MTLLANHNGRIAYDVSVPRALVANLDPNWFGEEGSMVVNLK